MDPAKLAKDLERKQELIDRLGSEAAQRGDALQRLGAEVLNIRSINAKLEKDNAQIQKAIDVFTEKGMLDVREIFTADRDRVIVAHVTLLQQYKLHVRRNREYLERLQRLQNDLITKNELTLKARLSEAHAAQNAFKKALEAKITDADLFTDAIRRQERAIEALEEMVTAKSRADPEARIVNTVVDSPALTLLREENSDLERKIERARMEISELNVAETSSGGINGLYAKLQASKAKVKALREENLVANRRKAEKGGQGGGAEGPRARAEAAEARALELEAELLSTAKEQASELTALQMQLLET